MLYTARVEVSTVQPPTARIVNTLAPSPRAPTVGGSGARRIHSPVGIDVSMYRWFSVLYGSESNLIEYLYVL
jgi:hypothetical protein